MSAAVAAGSAAQGGSAGLADWVEPEGWAVRAVMVAQADSAVVTRAVVNSAV